MWYFFAFVGTLDSNTGGGDILDPYCNYCNYILYNIIIILIRGYNLHRRGEKCRKISFFTYLWKHFSLFSCFGSYVLIRWRICGYREKKIRASGELCPFDPSILFIIYIVHLILILIIFYYQIHYLTISVFQGEKGGTISSDILL